MDCESCYLELKREGIKGWQTWNVQSVLSHVLMPYGLSVNLIFKDGLKGHTLSEALVGRIKRDQDTEEVLPQYHAFDGSYTALNLRWRGLQATIESAVKDGELYLLITSDNLPERGCLVAAEVCFLWNRQGEVKLCGDKIYAKYEDGEAIFNISKPLSSDKNLPAKAPYLCAEMANKTAIYTGKPRSIEQIEQIISQARFECEAKADAYGELGQMYLATECALGWDTIYDPNGDRIISPVSRIWSLDHGGWVMFCWDNFFAGFMSAIGSKLHAYSNIIEIAAQATPEGFVPNYSNANGVKSLDRSQPPVGSAMTLEVYRIYREKWLIEYVFDGLFKWNTWFELERMNDDGTLSWGSNPVKHGEGNYFETDCIHKRFGAALESGLDNSPMYDDIPYDEATNRLKLGDVGLTGLYILDCKSLIALANEIGKADEAQILKQRLDRAEAGLETLWDEQNGFYYNRLMDTGEFSRRISPTNFYALFSDNVSTDRQRRIADNHYYNPNEFYGKWMLPSISRDDPAYPEQTYWRGRVWGPMNFLTYLALANTELEDVKKDLAQKSLDIFKPEWDENRHVHENYSAISGEGCDVYNSDRFYHWGALLAITALAQAGYIKDLGKELSQIG